MTQNSFMPLVGMGILAAVAVGFMSKKSPSPAAGMDSFGYSSSYGGGGGSSSAPGVAEAVKNAPAVAPASTVVNTGGGSGTPNISYAAWKKNADGTYTDTKGTVSTADDVKHGWQNNNPSAGVTGAVSGVSQQAFDERIVQDRSSNPLYKDVPVNRGLPFLTKAPNNGVVGAVAKANTAPVLNTGNVQSKEMGGNDTVGTVIDYSSVGARSGVGTLAPLSIAIASIPNLVTTASKLLGISNPLKSGGVAGVIA